MWDDAGGGCNVAVPNLPRREVGPAGVYWLALGPPARTSGGRLGTASATFLPLLVAEDVLSHALTFECVGQCSWKVLNRRRDAAMYRREQSAASALLNLYFSVSSAQHLAASTIAPTKVL